MTFKPAKPDPSVDTAELNSDQLAERVAADSYAETVDRLDLGQVRSPELLESIARGEDELATEMSNMIAKIHALLHEGKKSP